MPAGQGQKGKSMKNKREIMEELIIMDKDGKQVEKRPGQLVVASCGSRTFLGRTALSSKTWGIEVRQGMIMMLADAVELISVAVPARIRNQIVSSDGHGGNDTIFRQLKCFNVDISNGPVPLHLRVDSYYLVNDLIEYERIVYCSIWGTMVMKGENLRNELVEKAISKRNEQFAKN